MSGHDGTNRIGPAGRIALVVIGCILALALPYVAISRALDGDGSPGPAHPAAATQGTTESAGGSTAAPAVSSTASPTTSRPADSSGDLAAARDSCRLANLRLRAALGAADVSLAQFEKHIDAMNLLVAGKISYSVATQFWDETRVGAAQNAAAFRAADRELTANRPSCSALDQTAANPLPYGSVVAVQRCAAYVKDAAAAMGRARTTLRTWEHHIHDMEMLRMGEITPAQATAKWHKNWKTGDEQLKDYRKAQRRAAAERCALS